MNRKSLLLLSIGIFTVLTATSADVRQRLTFDLDWKFKLCRDSSDVIQTLRTLGISDNPLSATRHNAVTTKVTDDTEPEQAQVTASEITTCTTSGHTNLRQGTFRNVQIPHDWSSELPFEPEMGGSAGYLAGGQGIYVKDFRLPASAYRQKKVRLHFDGVYHRATVWVNGQRAGYHVYGYTGFGYDITPFLLSDGPNRIVVHVNREEQSRWYTGSGIYRHVWLDVTGPTHIKTDGVFVTTADDGTVNIMTEIDTADADRDKRFIITNTILDTDGRTVNKVSEKWDTERPYLYTLVTRLKNSTGKVIDEVRTRFGFRDIRFDADKGFFLNGKNMKLKGMCLHQDCGSLGTAVPEEYWERRLKALKGIGCNAIRCSHNPPSTEFLDICDSLGLLVIDEAFDKWKSGYYAPFFDDCAARDIADMVIRDRNHPSVIVWSIGNEVSEAWKSDNEGIDKARMLNDIVKSLDPGRPTLVACQQGFQDKFGEVTDLVGYNYLEPRMIADHRRRPHRKMMVTEAFVYYSGLREDLVRDFVEENPWHFAEENDFIAGSFVWAGVDYLGESSPWPAKGWCSCPFDMTLKERPQAAYYHTAWQPDKEYLKLVVRDNCFDQPSGTDHWQYPPMADTWDLPYTDSRCVQIRCYTTCDSVQFFFPMWSNPQLPLKPRITKDYPDNCITLQLPARRGKVLAVGYKNGVAVMRDSLVNHGDVAGARLDFEGCVRLSSIPADMTPATSGKHRATATTLRLTLTDSLGRIQQMQPRRFSVRTEGPLRLLGVETGDMRRTDSWRTTELNTYFGEGLIRLQSTTQSGTGRVIVDVEGFDQPFVKELTIE